MHAPNSENLLAMCDRLGYLIIGEIPVWGDDDPQAFADNPQTKQWLNEMVERDFNHPSIVGWSVGNELRDPVAEWGSKTLTAEQYAYVNSMLDHLAVIDPTRLKTYVSITAYGSQTNLTNEPFEKLDFMSINSYSNAVKNVEKTHKTFQENQYFYQKWGLSKLVAARQLNSMTP
ncbi:glycoside hydrolase family 2 TIM barrel-domain containing protein [Paraglaciecola aquimarina]|uniref:Glycoside hydrolase family 2 TIM barrel-domain containing protein n=1 Tax=Paraglaciecola aquimarina TaxID=1235557 RepID=A0ABU3T176_9ALTE|nr:glycoside hydrolase family 2 TIM barrel-domain containing protein [Paraglaciecola aquimarina]MDU0356026.1 glycoside hydrolase family 2 TIM barrel-domain containing protein [Paraglaciecola aquimarina]